jgi:hypothetical protein
MLFDESNRLLEAAIWAPRVSSRRRHLQAGQKIDGCLVERNPVVVVQRIENGVGDLRAIVVFEDGETNGRIGIILQCRFELAREFDHIARGETRERDHAIELARVFDRPFEWDGFCAGPVGHDVRRCVVVSHFGTPFHPELPIH